MNYYSAVTDFKFAYSAAFQTFPENFEFSFGGNPSVFI